MVEFQPPGVQPKPISGIGCRSIQLVADDGTIESLHVYAKLMLSACLQF